MAAEEPCRPYRPRRRGWPSSWRPPGDCRDWLAVGGGQGTTRGAVGRAVGGNPPDACGRHSKPSSKASVVTTCRRQPRGPTRAQKRPHASASAVEEPPAARRSRHPRATLGVPRATFAVASSTVLAALAAVVFARLSSKLYTGGRVAQRHRETGASRSAASPTTGRAPRRPRGWPGARSWLRGAERVDLATPRSSSEGGAEQGEGVRRAMGVALTEGGPQVAAQCASTPCATPRIAARSLLAPGRVWRGRVRGRHPLGQHLRQCLLLGALTQQA